LAGDDARVTDSFVLHLSSTRLSEGDIRGVVEVVATGERKTVTTLDELRDLLIQRAGSRPADPGRPTDDRGAGATPQEVG
jgi:hypothetical protein